MLASFATMVWAGHEFTQPESVVAAQSMMLAHEGTLYYDLNRFPHTVCAYTPIFYCLEAALSKFGIPVYPAGRLISFIALLGIFSLIWRLLMLYTKDAAYAWMGVLLAACTSLLLNWGTVAQVDTLAVFFSIAAFYQYSRYEIGGERTLLWAALFAVLAFFTKQTALACPAAIVVLLWLKQRATSLRFAAGIAAAVVVVSLALNTATHGAFLANTVFANMFPLAVEKLNQHVRYILIASGQLILIVAVGARKAVRGPARPLFIYLGLALSVLAVTSPKIGSDSNYQIEFTILTILCACLSLYALGFYGFCRSRGKTWIALLQLPLAIYVLLNLRIFESVVAMRVVNEQQFRSQIAALERTIGRQGRVLSTEIDAMVHLRGRLEVEPLVYSMMVAAGRSDPKPLYHELIEARFSDVVLYEDVHDRIRDRDPEIPTLPDAQIEAIREHYTLVEYIPGPYLNGIYVYKPVGR